MCIYGIVIYTFPFSRANTKIIQEHYRKYFPILTYLKFCQLKKRPVEMDMYWNYNRHEQWFQQELQHARHPLFSRPQTVAHRGGFRIDLWKSKDEVKSFPGVKLPELIEAVEVVFGLCSLRSSIDRKHRASVYSIT